MKTIEINTVLTVISLLIAFASMSIAFIGLSRSKKKDENNEGKTEGVLASDVGYIKAGIDDLKRENRETRVANGTRDERITRCEESVRQAHKRIDGLAEYHKPHE